MMLKHLLKHHNKAFSPLISFQHLPLHFFSTSLKNYSHVSEFLAQTSTISSRNQIIQNVSEFLIPYFKQSEYQTLVNCLKILTCRIEPPLKGVELNLADNTLINVLSIVLDKTQAEVLEAYKEEGDLSKVAEKFFVPSPGESDLTIDELFDLLNSIMSTTGKGSKEKKEEILCHIISKFRTTNDIMFFVRFLQKGLRIGMSPKSVIAAIEKISKVEEIQPEIEKIETDVFGFSLGIGHSKEKPSAIVVGTPLSCMLSRPANSPTEVPKLLKKYCDKVLIEVKYDGERAQIHYTNGQVTFFSRNLENQNKKFYYWLEEISSYFKKLGVESCILDAEVVAYDDQSKKILSFSEISSFARKPTEEAQELPPDTNIALFIFDVLEINAKNLLHEPLDTRKEILEKHFPEKGVIHLAEGKMLNLEDPKFVEDLDEYFEVATKKNLEGLIIKALGPKTYYDTKGRTQWVKLKKNIQGKSLADTLDLVPIAGYRGKGKRSNSYGAYLLASYNKITKNYEAICKIGTGFSDEALIQLTESFKDHQITEKPKSYIVARTLKPDMWFSPNQVWEIECDKITLSPIYLVGKTFVDPDKGLSLRFPRMLRTRTDKTIEQSTNTQEIIDMFQRSNENGNGNGNGEAEAEVEVDESNMHKDNTEDPIFLIEGPQPDHDLSYPYTERNEDLSYIQKGVKLKNFRDNINKRNLECEFKLLRRLTENQMYTNQFRDYNPEIVRLDRYNQVVPFKHSMVKLPALSEGGTEAEVYINANYISSSKIAEPKAFIATQGPLEGTRGHFWRMIWHNDVKLIIMLCRCKEDGKSQSDQYWKQEEELEVDNFRIILSQTEKLPGALTKRVFTVKYADNEGNESEKTVTHYQWSGWPDHGTPLPEDYEVLENFIDIIYKERTASPNSPVVVHCSAGIGRSGTLIALYNLDIVVRENLHDLDNVKLSVFGVVRRLREQRWGMVNTSDQYSFIYKLMADRIDKYYKGIGTTQTVSSTQE